MQSTIVVPIKNQFKIVNLCLQSILKNCFDQEVILIDDGSDEILVKRMLEEFSKKYSWKLFENKKSLGHTEACSIGIQNSSNKNIFLLNSDTIITENSIQEMSKILDQKEDVAVIGPSTSSASGEQLDKYAFEKRFLWSIDEIEEYSKEIEKKERKITDIDLVNGFCFGIKKEVFYEVGCFDSALTCYGNEKELLVRIRKSGYRTVFVNNVYIHHFGKMSYSQEKGINIGVAQRDADRYILNKHGRLS